MSISSRLIKLESVIRGPDMGWGGEMVIPYSIEDAKLLHRLYYEPQTHRTKEEFEKLCARYKGVPLISLDEWGCQIDSELNGKKIDWGSDIQV